MGLWDQDERRGKLLEAQKDADVRRFEMLLTRTKQLRKVRGGIDSSQSSRLQMSAAVLLDAELAAADAEAEEIRLKHNLTFDQLEDDEDDEDEQPAESVEAVGVEAAAGESTEVEAVGVEAAEAETEAEASEQLSEEVIQEARELHARLTELEAAVDEAAAVEDFEKAAELEEEIAELSAKFVTLNVPPELLAEKPATTAEDADGATQVDSPNSGDEGGVEASSDHEATDKAQIDDEASPPPAEEAESGGATHPEDDDAEDIAAGSVEDSEVITKGEQLTETDAQDGEEETNAEQKVDSDES